MSSAFPDSERHRSPVAAAAPAKRRPELITWARGLALTAGLASILIATVSPLDRVAHALFSGHMAQHMVLVAFAAPLIALARPGLAVARGVPRRLARSANRAARPLRRLRRIAGPGAWAAIVLVLHVGTVWFWHFPAIYGIALDQSAVHVLSHATLLATAVIFWSCIAGSGRPGGVGRGAAIAIAFGAAAGTGILGALITFATVHLYPEHAASATEWGMAPLADQQLGGLLMWVPGGAVYLAAALVLVVRLLGEVDAGSPRRSPDGPEPAPGPTAAERPVPGGVADA